MIYRNFHFDPAISVLEMQATDMLASMGADLHARYVTAAWFLITRDWGNLHANQWGLVVKPKVQGLLRRCKENKEGVSKRTPKVSKIRRLMGGKAGCGTLVSDQVLRFV